MRWVLTYPSGVGQVIDRPVGRAPLPRNWTRGPEPRRWLSVIGESTEVSQETRLAIYGDGYFLRIVDVMANNLSSVANVVGEHDFKHHLAREYLVKYPSTHKCIDNIGEFMPAFIARHPLGRRYPFLSDLARLDWGFHESFFSDDWPLLDPRTIQNVPESQWPRARIVLDPAVRLIDLRWDLVPLWRADGKWPAGKRKSVKKKAVHVLLFRTSEPHVRVSEESAGSFALLKAFQAGQPFGVALRLAQRKGLQANEASSLFSEWVRTGVIRKVAFS